MSIEEVAAKAKLWGDKSTESWQLARKIAAEADFAEATLDNSIQKVAYETQGALINITIARQI